MDIRSFFTSSNINKEIEKKHDKKKMKSECVREREE